MAAGSRSVKVKGLLLTLVLCIVPGGAIAQSPQDIPQGFDFPAVEGQLEEYLASRDIEKLRSHAWMLWAGINQTLENGQRIWETWISPRVTYDPEGGALLDAVPEREFSPARQFEGLREDLSVLDLSSQPIEVIQFVLFNRANHKHIRDEQLFLPSTLENLNNSLPDGPVKDRMIPEFPRDAVALKVMWWPVSGNSVTKLPVWDFDPKNQKGPGSDTPANPLREWKRFVAISPNGSLADGSTVPEDHPRVDLRGASAVSIDRFFTWPLSDRQIDGINNEPRFDGTLDFALSRELRPGDRIALIGMHITTKEIPNWVWATYWWHDRPDEGYYATYRPDMVPEVFRNFLMDVGYDFYEPREFDGTPDAVFNPYLEARFPNGVSSSCMSCHGRAVYPAVRCCSVMTRGENDPFFNRNFPTGVDPAYQGRRMRLDFLWSGLRALDN